MQGNKDIFFELATDMFCITSFNGYFKQINHRWEEALGFTREELTTKPAIEFVHPSDLERTQAYLVQLLTDAKASHTFENRYWCKDGSVKWFSWRIRVDYSTECFYAIVRDLTYEKQVEAALQAKDAHMKALIRYTPIAIAMLDEQLRFLEINDQFRQEFGLKDSITVDSFFSEAFPVLSQQWKNMLLNVLSGTVVRKHEFSYVTASGGKAQYLLDLRPWYYEDARLGGIVCMIENVTLQKIALEEVNRKSQQLNGILKNMPVIVYLINSQGVLVRVMGAGLKAMGVKEIQLEGHHASVMLGEDNADLTCILLGEKNYLVSHGKNGDREWVYEHYLFPDNVRNEGIIGFALDITERKKWETELQLAKEKAETASQLKTRFLANMSHEIRTPLNAIIGFAEVLRKQDINAGHLEYLEHITSSGKLLLKLIGDVLDLSKIEEGKLQINRESFHFKEVISSAIMPYKYQANEKGLSFSISFDEHLPAYVFGDSHKLNQIIINLIGNALKFTKEGNISVHFSCLNSASQGGESIVRVSVADTGTGIPPEYQSKVFNSFTQADTSVVRNYGGSGLGLSIVKDLVQRMGGEINITSPSNVPAFVGGPGSTFWFVLRLEVDQTAAPQAELCLSCEEQVRFDGMQVLVAEDNILNQKLIRILLTDVGCNVDFANNGEDALHLLGQKRYDLVFMDVQMPIMDGYTATRLTRDNLKLDTPIVGLTANVYKEDIEHCLQAGMNDFLGKPYHEAQLYKKLIRWGKTSPHLHKSTILPPVSHTVPVKPAVSDNSFSDCEPSKYTNLTFLQKMVRESQIEMKDFIQMYLNEQEEFLLICENAPKEKRWMDIGKAVHKFRPSLQMVSQETLKNNLSVLEDYCCKGGGQENIPELIEQAKYVCVQIKRELNAELTRISEL